MPTKRMSGKERRKQIILTAVELFAENGFTKATTRQIAAAAGVNEAMIYKHFASKEELFDAVNEYYIQLLAERFREHFDEDEGPVRNKTIDLAHKITDFLSGDDRFLRLMLFSGLQGNTFAEKYFSSFGVRALGMIQQGIVEGQEAGKIRSDIDPLYTALVMVGNVIFFNIARNITLREFFKQIDKENFLEHMDKIVNDGINVRQDGEER